VDDAFLIVKIFLYDLKHLNGLVLFSAVSRDRGNERYHVWYIKRGNMVTSLRHNEKEK